MLPLGVTNASVTSLLGVCTNQHLAQCWTDTAQSTVGALDGEVVGAEEEA